MVVAKSSRAVHIFEKRRQDTILKSRNFQTNERVHMDTDILSKKRHFTAFDTLASLTPEKCILVSFFVRSKARLSLIHVALAYHMVNTISLHNFLQTFKTQAIL